MSVKVVLFVEGMMCQKNCGSTVTEALRAVPGCIEADVSFSKSAAYVLVNLETVPSVGHFVSSCIGAVEDVGFDCERLEARKPSLVLEVLGMMCNNSCTPTVYNAIMSASPERIVHAVVSLDESEARIWGPIGKSDDEVSAELIIDAIEVSGFDVNVKDVNGSKEGQKSSQTEKPRNSNVRPTAPVGTEKKWSVDNNSNNSSLMCTELSISGMSCASCVRSVETGLLAMDGVRDVRIALLLEKGEILFDSVGLKSGADSLKKKVEELGYRAHVLSSRRYGDIPRRCLSYRLHGMSTVACTTKIESALNGCKGVHSAKVDVSREVLLVTLEVAEIKEAAIAAGRAGSAWGEHAMGPGFWRSARDLSGLVALMGW